eukprot:TRINITY_DN73616_c0_g1_i1.p1 TRINITY_DN73616_c0_g1~~TRINITY_DN73616_c0_g1_i1.p1  ORF type:complete len:478 (+),score=99.44 TRINITY_DN73616_c0_g1_i1:134-1567(+)
MRRRDRSRSSARLHAPTAEEQEKTLAGFAQHFWLPPDNFNTPPWQGERAARIVHYRHRLLSEVEDAVGDYGPLGCVCEFGDQSKEVTSRWQRFAFWDDVARMSDVLFRGPIEPRHADEIEMRLHDAWRRLRSSIADLHEFSALTIDFRVSAVRLVMMLETERPPEAAQLDGQFELPNARTLASLLSLRCEKDDGEEVLELYRLLCQKLQGSTCVWCNEPFDESTSAGLFEGEMRYVVPTTVPKVFVPQCGHAIHTLCFGSQLIPESDQSSRGDCRRCQMPYAWSSIDVEPMVNAFCLLFSPFVDKRAQDMNADGRISQSAIISIAEVCINFSLELAGLVSASSAWLLLARRGSFKHPDVVEIIGDEVMRLLNLPPEGDADDLTEPVDDVSPEDAENPCKFAVHPETLHVPRDGAFQELEDDPLDLPPPAQPEDCPPSPGSEAEVDLGDIQDPSAVMLNQLVEGCGGDVTLSGLRPLQ